MQMEITEIAAAIYDWLRSLTWEKAEEMFAGVAHAFQDFKRRWTDRNVFRAARFQGYVVGYVLLDIVVGMLGGALLRAASRLGGATVRAIGELGETRRLVSRARRLGAARKLEAYALKHSAEAGRATAKPRFIGPPAPEPPVTTTGAPGTFIGPPAPDRFIGPPAPGYGDVPVRKLRNLARTDPLAAEELIARYEKLSDKQLRAAVRRGDGTAAAVLERRVAPNRELDELRGQKGDVRMPHAATAKVTGPDGSVKWTGSFESGGMTAEQRAQGFPKGPQATHTEAKAIADAPLHRGDTLRITGQYDPCQACRAAMQKASEGGKTVEYWWQGGVFRAVDGKIVLR
jgi:hypothetical protein